MRKALDHILGKWPALRAKIIELYNSDDDFRILCEDYLTSSETIEDFRQKKIKNCDFENEFIQVNQELEKEVLHLLEKNRL
jgi:hypothetical protein